MKTFKLHNFRIDSTGWEKIISDGKEYLVNPTDDVWEITDEDCKGEQLFTWDAAMRETQKAGERMPTDEEFSEILKTKKDMPNLVFSGYRNTTGTCSGRGTYTRFWSSTQSGARAWNHRLNTSNSAVGRNDLSKAYGFSVRCIEEIPQQLKYKINVSVKKGMEDTPFTEFELDNQHFYEAFQIKELATFKDDAYLVFTLKEIPAQTQ